MGSRVFAAALTTALAAGCGQATDSAIPTAPLSPMASTSSSAPCKTCYSRANVVWADSVSVGAAGIRGDGRNRYGQASAPHNEYQGDFCGVRGFLYDGSGQSGNLDFDPDTYYDAATMSSQCGAVRTMAFYLGGQSAPPKIFGPHVIVSALWSFAPGEVRLQPQRLPGGGTCWLWFDAQYTGASDIRVTRLPDLAGAVRQWRVESQGNHTAACATLQSNGKYLDTGIRYYLPFAATVTQVPYPSASYP